MAIFNNIVSQTFTNQTNNYSYATQDVTMNFLKANVGEIIEVESKIEMYLYIEPTTCEIYNVTGGKRIVLTDGKSWTDEGFNVEDEIGFLYGYSGGGFELNGIITSISEDGKSIFTTFNSLPIGQYPATDEVLVVGTTLKTNASFKYDFVGNDDDTPDFLDNSNGDLNRYDVSGISFGIASGISQGKRWRNENDFFKIERENNSQTPVYRNGGFAGGNFGNTNFSIDSTQNYTLTHRVQIPYIETSAELNNLKNNIIPTRFQGDQTFKYVSSLEFKKNISDPSSENSIEFVANKGSVGYYNQNYNNGQSDYELGSIKYFNLPSSDPNRKQIQSLTVDNKVYGELVIDRKTAFVGTPYAKYTLQHSIIPINIPTADDYKDNNYFSDSLNSGDVGTKYIIGLTETLTTANYFHLEFEVDFVGSGIKEGTNYLLSLIIDDDNTTLDDSKKVNLLLDVDVFTKNLDIPGLISYQESKITKLEGVEIVDFDTAYTDLKGWVQDYYEYETRFKLSDVQNTNIDRIGVKIVAWKDEFDYFVLDEYDYSYNTVVDARNVQFIDYENVLQSTNSDTNLLQEIKTEELIVDDIEYIVKLRTRLNWQKWLSQPDADKVFLDLTKENNGLNKNISNYSLKNDYELKIISDLDLTNIDGIYTRYVDLFNLEVSDFGVNVGENWEVFSKTNNYKGGDTDILFGGEGNENLFNIKLKNLDTSTFNISEYYFIVRIEPVDVNSNTSTIQLSSLIDDYNVYDNPNFPLKGIVDSQLLTVTKTGDIVDLDFYIDGEYLDDTEYCITARLGKISTEPLISGEYSNAFSNAFFI